MSHTTDLVTFKICVEISFFSLLLCPEHGDIQKISYTAQRQTDLSLKIFSYKLNSYRRRNPTT